MGGLGALRRLAAAAGRGVRAARQGSWRVEADLATSSVGSKVEAPADDSPDQILARRRAREVEPVVEVGARVDCRDGHVGRVARLLRDPGDDHVTHLVVHRRALFRRSVVVPVHWATSVAPGRIFVDVGKRQLAALPEYRPDKEIAADAARALWDDELLRRDDWPTLRVDARNGVVTLRGHVVNRLHREQAEVAARRVRGVRELRNRLVADDELEAAIAQALAADLRTAAHKIKVRAASGIVHLSGDATPADVEAAAEEVAAGMPGVRGIVCRLRGTDVISPPASAVLPAIGVRVFAADGMLGYLERVVMNPRSRAITHLIVMVGQPDEARDDVPPAAERERRRLLIPMALVDLWIDDAELDRAEDAVLLRIDRATAAKLPPYRESYFVAPGDGWHPPFDYRRDEVRFLRD